MVKIRSGGQRAKRLPLEARIALVRDAFILMREPRGGRRGEKGPRNFKSFWLRSPKSKYSDVMPSPFLSLCRWYDLRVKSCCKKRGCSEDVLISLPRAVTCIDLHPTEPWTIAVGCSDARVKGKVTDAALNRFAVRLSPNQNTTNSDLA